MENENNSAAQALSQIIEVLGRLDEASRSRVLKSVSTFFHTSVDYDAPVSVRAEGSAPQPQTTRPAFSEDLSPSPKHFLFEKQPQTDVERVACLAYYLTHFRETPYFKTLDIAKLNTEAAQPKFSNAAYAVNNAANSGYLAAASKNARQISAAGEQFVMALPDRAAAKASMSLARKKALSRKKREKAE
jgi:hypothetical protein